jgi:hypothetical protein
VVRRRQQPNRNLNRVPKDVDIANITTEGLAGASPQRFGVDELFSRQRFNVKPILIRKSR